MKEYTRAEMSEKFQTELEEAKEVARYELEQEHLENLRQLEQSLGEKHEEQLRGLAELQGKHVQEINILKAGHVAEVERLKNELAQAHSEQLSAVSLDAEREVSQVNKHCFNSIYFKYCAVQSHFRGGWKEISGPNFPLLSVCAKVE